MTEPNKPLKALSPLKGKYHRVFFAPLLKIIECICEIAVPFMVRFIIDDGLSEGGRYYHDSTFIISMCLVIFGLAVAGFVFTMIAQYVASRTSTEFGYGLKKNIYGKLSELSAFQVEQYGKNKALNLVNNDAFALQNGVQMFMRLLVRAPFLVIGTIVASYILNPLCGAVVTGALALCAGIVTVVIRITPKQYSQLQAELDSISSSGEDNIVGARVVRAFNKQENEEAKFKEKTEAYRKRALLIAKINAYINPLTFAFVNLAIILILYFGSYQKSESGVTIGTIVALISLLTQSLNALIQFTRLTTAVSKGYASKKRIDEFLAIPPTLVSGDLKEEPETAEGDRLYELRDVSVCFGGEGNALEHISLSIAKGQTVGIIGGTGSGKSTLLRLLVRAFDPSEGTVYFNGHDIKESQLANLSQNVAFISQKPQIFQATVRENVTLGKPCDDAWVKESLRLALADEFVGRYADGLDHPISQGGTNLSGGQKQRLLIARAICSKRNVVFLDDATSALDYQSDLRVRQNLSSLKDLTLILVSQRATSVRGCDVIFVLDQGKLVGQGKHDELLASCPAYQEIYEAQVKQS